MVSGRDGVLAGSVILALVAAAVGSHRQPPGGGIHHLRPLHPPVPAPSPRCAAALNQSCLHNPGAKLPCLECVMQAEEELIDAGNCTVLELARACDPCTLSLHAACGNLRYTDYTGCVQCMLNRTNVATMEAAGCCPADRGQFCRDGTFIDTIGGINWPPDGWDPCVGPWPPPAWGNVKQLMYSGAGTVGNAGNLQDHGWGQQGRCPEGSTQEGLWNAIVPTLCNQRLSLYNLTAWND